MLKLHRTLFLALSLFLGLPDVHGWGQKGHDVTCEIAERHLDRGAKRAVKKLLEGKSMVYWSNWKLKRLKRIMQRPRHLLCPTTVLTDGHLMFLW